MFSFSKAKKPPDNVWGVFFWGVLTLWKIKFRFVILIFNNKKMNPLLKTALVALVVVFVYDRFLKETIDGMFNK